MGNKRNGWAFGFGIYGGAYQLFAGFILILFCSKIGGVPYGLSLILSGLICGAVAFFSYRHQWAKLALLFIGVAGILLVFGLGFLIEKLGGFKQGAESMVLLFRIICFNPAVFIFLSGIWSFEIEDDKKKKFYISSIVCKVVLLLGVALFAAVSALKFWQVMSNADFTEWLYGVMGDETLTGSALIEAQLLLRSEFTQWINSVGPLFEGLGILLIAIVPTYVWYLDSEGILLGRRNVLASIIVSAVEAPFLIAAEIFLIGEFVSFGTLASLILGIVTLLAVGAAWFFFYWFPVLRGKRTAIFYNEAVALEAAVEDDAPVAAEV